MSGRASARSVIARRGAARREAIAACGDEAQLEGWIARAATAATVEEIFARAPG